MEVLDLFCCCGGASMGLHQSGFHVTGVDITDNHQYPFDFIHKDVFDLDIDFLKSFDFIWASPPCQCYSLGTLKHRYNGKKYPDLVNRTRELLLKTRVPFIIENVIGAPIRKDLMLCGEMFGLRVIRHRIFETEGFTILQPPHEKHKHEIQKYYTVVAGNNYGTLLRWQDAMGINWITNKKHLAQAVPPAYSKFIAERLGLFCFV